MTKEQFLEVYNKYPPKKLWVWFFKYFSESTKPEDKLPGKILMWGLIGQVVAGIIMTASGISALVSLLYRRTVFRYRE